MLKDKEASASALRLRPAYSKEALEKDIGLMRASIKRIQDTIEREKKGILLRQQSIQGLEEAIIQEKTKIAHFESLVGDIDRYERTRH